MLFLAALSLALGATGPSPYPISPQPLRLLVERSPFIVVAQVREAEPAKRERVLAEGFVIQERVVVLEIERLVKGDPGVERIEQEVSGAICPAPARYIPGERVLAFLDRSGQGFSTPARSYGAKVLDDACLELYVERIREQLAILEETDPEVQLARQVEWLVKCAEASATRWEGAYELAPAGDFMYHYDRDRTRDFASHLTALQRDRLLAAFLDAKSFSPGERCLEELFRDDGDPRLLAWLVGRLRAHHGEVERGYGSVSFLIQRIARRDSRPEVQALAAEFERRRRSHTLDGGVPGGLEVCRALLELY